MAYVPPDYAAILGERKQRYQMLISKPELIPHAFAYYKTRPIEFIQDWGVTYDPRNAGKGSKLPTMMPFVLFPRQEDLVQFLYECFIFEEHGAIEKCRDAGATWVACNFSVWAYLFIEGVSIGWGSRKELLVDRLGDPDCIFEKIRMVFNNLPSFFKPKKYNENEHSSRMKLINPDTDASITGEAGDNIGRGGRKKIYFKDESAHYERPDAIEAALGDNTNVQIDISSVNGPATVFQRRVEAGETWEYGKEIPSGVTRVFIFDWQDDPRKDQEWYDKRRKRAEEEGLLHVFAQEVDRDSTAAVEGIVIPGDWVRSAIDAHIKLGLDTSGMRYGALDVADEGTDKHALAIRTGILLNHSEAWPYGDVGQATQKALFKCRKKNVPTFLYDCIGVGAGVKSELNRLKREKILPDSFEIVSWNASKAPLRPNARVVPKDKQSPRNKDFYANLKAQGWWQLRTRFEKTHKMLAGTHYYPADELISIDSRIGNIKDLMKEFSQATYSINGAGKILIDKKPNGTRSPNRADAVMMSFWPKHKKTVLT